MSFQPVKAGNTNLNLKKNKRNKLIATASASVAAQTAINNNKLINTILRVAVSDEIYRKKRRIKPRFLRKGSILNPKLSVREKVDENGDKLEFLQFTAFTRQSFDLLVELCHESLNNHPTDPRFSTPEKKHLSRRMFLLETLLQYTLPQKSEICEVGMDATS